jgi:succinate dehydrogenase/fumarate reductase flavoprotein subunit
MVSKKGEGEDVVAPQAEDTSREAQEPVGVKHAAVVNALEACAASGTAQDIATRMEASRVAREGGTTSEAQAKRTASTVERAMKELEASGQVWSRERDGKTEYLLETTFPRSKNPAPR